jgi:ankyrin repeat protein
VCRNVDQGANADVNLARTDNGQTPLYIAASNGYEKCVAMLIKANADVNLATTDDGQTPLYIAAQEGHEKCVAMLIKANADATWRQLMMARLLYI